MENGENSEGFEAGLKRKFNSTKLESGTMALASSRITRSLAATLGLLATAAAYFLSTGLRTCWPLVWLAPIPVMILAVRTSAPLGAIAAFVAFLLGSLNLAVYLAQLVPPAVVALALGFPALVFALAVMAWRWLVTRECSWSGILMFPAIWTAYEYVTAMTSPHGIFGSLAYTQADCLPVVQTAAVTGIWGLTFLITFLPAGLAAAWHRRNRNGPTWMLGVVPLALVLLVSGWGWFRLRSSDPQDTLRVGLAATDATVASFDTEQREEALLVLRAYADRIESLADQGAEVVVLPEKFVGIARAAQQGLVTVSDHRGRIIVEAGSGQEGGAQVIGKVSLGPGGTIYSRLGDWFGAVSVILLIFLGLYAVCRSRRLPRGTAGPANHSF